MKQASLIALICTSLALICSSAEGQDMEHYHIKKVRADRELTSYDVVDIAQDKRGLMWFATEEGLNCYDGNSFRHIYKSETTAGGIAGNELASLLDDASDPILWIGTQHDGLTAYDYSDFTYRHFRHDAGDSKSLSYNGVTDIASADEGFLWVATYQEGVDLLDVKTGEFQHFNTSTVSGLASNFVWTVAYDGKGTLYVGHVNQGLSIVDVKRSKAIRLTATGGDAGNLPDNEVRAICIASDGNVYVGTDGGVACYNPRNKSLSSIPLRGDGQQPRVYALREVSGGRLLVATEQRGVMEVILRNAPGESRDLHPLTYRGDDSYASTMRYKSVRCIYEDSSENVWVGMWADGIDLINKYPPLFNYLSHKAFRPSPEDIAWKSVGSVLTDADGDLWVGTDGGGINQFKEGKRVAIYDKDSGVLRNNSVQAALRDSKGNLWWGCYIGGAVRYDSGTGTITRVFDSENASADVRVFLEYPGLGMLVGTSEGLYVADMESGRVVGEPKTGRRRVRALTLDGDGRIWIGFYDGGVSVVNRDFSCQANYSTENSILRSNTINTLITDSEGMVWAGSNDGLVCFDPLGKTDQKIFLRSQGLANTHIRSLIEDMRGRIWICTNKGISCLWDGKIFSYGEPHGILPGYFMDRAATLAPDGSLYLGSVDGLCHFYPDIATQTVPVAKAIVHMVEVLGENDNVRRQVRLTGEAVRVKFSENSLRVGFHIENLALAPFFDYTYRISGLDGHWHPITQSGTITLHNIPSGHYELEIRVSRHGSTADAEITTLELRVAPPAWRSWWAYAIYAIVVCAIVIVVFYLYRRRLQAESQLNIEEMRRRKEKELNEERLRFYTNLTHELRTPLTLILGPLDDLRHDLQMPEVLARRVETIHNSAMRLLGIVNQLLEFRKTETQNWHMTVVRANLGHTVMEVGLRFKELNANTDVTYSIDVDTENTTIFYDPDIIISILTNFLSNAAKYTPTGEIRISVAPVEEDGIRWVAVSVADTGVGIAPDALPNIFNRYYQADGDYQTSGTGIGLALVKSLAELHEGKLAVESEIGKGSTFTLLLRADNTYPKALHQSPRDESDDAEEEESMSQMQARPWSAGRKVILVVEDNLDIREYIAESLRQEFVIIEASDGKEGWELAREKTPDIIISDIMMPVMDGVELCRKVKEDISTSHILVILLTAKGSIADKEEGYDSGADSYITKPFSVKLLRSRINNLLETRRLMTQQLMQASAGIYNEGSTNASAPTDDARSQRMPGRDSMKFNALDEQFLRRLYSSIESNISSPDLDINFLCAELGMSVSSLYRKIKGLTGMSGNTLIRTFRLRNAIRLMTEEGRNISEAAYRSGFSNVAYFRSCFKAEYGMSPSEYLQKRGIR